MNRREIIKLLRDRNPESRRMILDDILLLFRAAEFEDPATRQHAGKKTKIEAAADIEARQIWQRIVDQSRKGKARRKGKGQRSSRRRSV